MKTMCSYAIGFLSVALLLPGLLAGFAQIRSSTPAPAPTPPVIEEIAPIQSDNYKLGPDSQPHSSIPAGKTFKFDLTDSKIFPGTVRTITVYVPAAYKGGKPACVYVGLDDLGFNAPTVFDNLIAQHAMPVTIGIGLSPGVVSSASPPDNPRFDRSYEFDSLNDRLARFLLDEVLPEVEKHRTPDGDSIVLSKNPNDRAIGGASTGGIAAFTVAWQRPDAFRRVFSSIGTFVGMRGGEQYYVLVRKTEPKPLRVFMQDGVYDEWGGGPEMGDWWMSNQTMNRALEFAGYDVRHIWGAGTHNTSQAASIFPDAMRWLWRDWPAPIQTGEPGNPVLKSILQPGQDWQIAADGCTSVNNLASNPQGKIFYQTGGVRKISQIIAEGKPIQCRQTGGSSAFAFGPDGRLYLARPEGGIEVTLPDRTDAPATVLAEGLHVRNLTVRNNGDIYATTEAPGGASELWIVSSKGEKMRLDEGLKGTSGVALSPDGLWLFVAQSLSRTGFSYRVRSDGTLDSRAPFYDFYVPAWADDSGAAGISMDRDGRAYVATRMGVQVFDRSGRVTAILPLPGNEPATSVCFGGHDFDTLYVAGGGKVYRRKLRIAGAPSWAVPGKLLPEGAG
jgi:gluconolactonase